MDGLGKKKERGKPQDRIKWDFWPTKSPLSHVLETVKEKQHKNCETVLFICNVRCLQAAGTNVVFSAFRNKKNPFFCHFASKMLHF